MSKILLDVSQDKGVKKEIYLEGHGHEQKLVVNTSQDVEGTLKHNEAMKAIASENKTKNRGEGRVIADVPIAIYHQWKQTYGFDMLNPANSNWGMGMTRLEHKKFLRALLNANPALKTVDESL